MTDLITAAQQALEALIENARLLGGTQAKKAFGCYSQEDANLERAWHEGIARHSGTIRAALAQQAEPGAWGRRREMNKENIIRMAREACETTNWKPGLGNEHVVEFMTRFAAIAAAAGADAALEAAARQAQQAVDAMLASELERIAHEPPVSGNEIAQARVLLAAAQLRGA